MTPLVWLAAAAVAGVAAYVVGWPAWQGSRERETRDLNTERYRAWRGTSVRGQPAAREGMTDDERRRMYGAALLGVVAIACLVVFFLAS
jgi:hypothetical protein